MSWRKQIERTSLIWALIDAINWVYSSICLQDISDAKFEHATVFPTLNRKKKLKGKNYLTILRHEKRRPDINLSHNEHEEVIER